MLEAYCFDGYTISDIKQNRTVYPLNIPFDFFFLVGDDRIELPTSCL